MNRVRHRFRIIVIIIIKKKKCSQRQWRVEYTGSPRVTEVKQRPARLGFGWVTIQILTLVMLAIPGPTQAR